MAVVEYAFDLFLHGGLGRGARESFSGYFQFGSGLPVYEPRFYRAITREADSNQYGRTRTGFRQYFCREALEEREVRGCLSKRLSNDGRSQRRATAIFSILQRRAVSSSTPISNAKTGLCGQHGLERINKFKVIYKKEGKKEKQTSLTQKRVLTMGSTLGETGG